MIVNHVKAMARKVDEMMLHEKYQNTSKAETGKPTILITMYPASIPPPPLLDFNLAF